MKFVMQRLVLIFRIVTRIALPGTCEPY